MNKAQEFLGKEKIQRSKLTSSSDILFEYGVILLIIT